MAGVKIIGLGRAKGEKIVTNDDLAQIVETSDEWIREKSGIRTRNFAVNKSNEDLATEAAENAIKQSGINREDIGFCIVATFTPDNFAPHLSSCVAGNLGLSNKLMTFDVNAGCTGFLFALNIASGLLAQSSEKYALVIGSEKISPVVDMTDRRTCVLFGDGAGAAVIEYSDEADYYFTSGFFPNKEVLYCEREPAAIRMAGQEVYRFAVSKVPEAINTLLKETGKTEKDIDYFVCHQANERIIDNAARRITKNTEKFFKNLYNYGNTSAASIPIALSEMADNGLLKGRKQIVCTGFGAGLTYGSMLIAADLK